MFVFGEIEMCMCCGILETLALCAGLKVIAVCKKKQCECPRPHSKEKGIEVLRISDANVATISSNRSHKS